LIVIFLGGAFFAGVAFDGDTPVGGVAFYDTGDLVDAITAVRRKISAVKLKVYTR